MKIVYNNKTIVEQGTNIIKLRDGQTGEISLILPVKDPRGGVEKKIEEMEIQIYKSQDNQKRVYATR